MSHFIYGEHTSKRIGVWLRYRSNSDIIQLVKKNRNKRFLESVERVVVSEYDSRFDEVWIEVWCYNTLSNLLFKKHRYNVFYIKTRVNEEWICEGDLGKGLK